MNHDHYTDGRRWSYISNAWIFATGWNQTEEIARLSYEIEQLRAQLAEQQVCSVCKCPTEMACSDCRIDFATTIYVCPTKLCRRYHESLCSSRLKERLAELHDKIMNLPYQETGLSAREAHRDARHAFAELVAGLCEGVGNIDVLADAEKRGMENAGLCKWCIAGDHSYHSDGSFCTRDNRFNADCRCDFRSRVCDGCGKELAEYETTKSCQNCAR